jgi:hypothetical protein
MYVNYVLESSRDNQSTTYLFGSIQIRCVLSGRSKKPVEIIGSYGKPGMLRGSVKVAYVKAEN